MHLIKFLFFISSLLLSPEVFSQSTIEIAEILFDKKYEVIENGKASSTQIDSAIAMFKKSKVEPQKTIGLLKCYEFKASWTAIPIEDQQALYEKAIALAEEKTRKYPENGAIAYWHAANYARRADLLELTEAAQEGVIDELRKLAENAAALDKNYNQAGALRLLGGIHLKVPSIPLVLSWPSEDKARQLLEQAYKIAPQHPANVYLYAKMLHTFDRDEKASAIFEELIEREERKNYYLVDQKYIQKAKEYYQENF